MTNDGMMNETQMPNAEKAMRVLDRFVIRASSFIRHS